MFGRLVIEGIVRVWRAEQSLDREKYCSDLQGWTPVGFQDIEADSAQVIDVWMVNLGAENTLGRRHGVVVWQEEFGVEFASFIRASRRPVNFDDEMPEIRRVSVNFHAWNLLFFEVL
jgi:hypothetical protein